MQDKEDCQDVLVSLDPWDDQELLELVDLLEKMDHLDQQDLLDHLDPPDLLDMHPPTHLNHTVAVRAMILTMACMVINQLRTLSPRMPMRT